MMITSNHCNYESSIKTKCSNYHCKITYCLNFVQRHNDLKLQISQQENYIPISLLGTVCHEKRFQAHMHVSKKIHVGPNMAIYRNRHNPLKTTPIKLCKPGFSPIHRKNRFLPLPKTSVQRNGVNMEPG
jgi:hypothetical protein